MINKELYETIREVQERYPSWRFGQVIANAIRAYDGRLNCDPFYIEDEKLLEGVKRLLA